MSLYFNIRGSTLSITDKNDTDEIIYLFDNKVHAVEHFILAAKSTGCGTLVIEEGESSGTSLILNENVLSISTYKLGGSNNFTVRAKIGLINKDNLDTILKQVQDLRTTPIESVQASKNDKPQISTDKKKSEDSFTLPCGHIVLRENSYLKQCKCGITKRITSEEYLTSILISEPAENDITFI